MASFNLLTAFVQLKTKGLEPTIANLGKVKGAAGGAAGAKGIGGLGAALGGVIKVASRLTIIAGGLFRIGKAAAFAVSKVIRLGFSFAKLTGEQQAAEARLRAVFKATGGAAGRSVEQIKELASQLQQVTRFGDEATIGAAAILASFKSIKGVQFDATIASMQDIASLMGTDMKSAALQLGKALEDPEQNLGALTRSGVSFNEMQKELIKNLAASGRVGEAQAIMLKTIRGQLAGVAEAEGATFLGAMEQMKNSIGDAKEALGELLIPALQQVGAALQQGAAFVIANKDRFVEWGKTIAATVSAVTTPVAAFFKLLVTNSDVAVKLMMVKFSELKDRLLDVLVIIGRAFVNAFGVILKRSITWALTLGKVIAAAIQGGSKAAHDVLKAQAREDLGDIFGGTTQGLGVDREGTRAAREAFRGALEDAGFKDLADVLKAQATALPDFDAALDKLITGIAPPDRKKKDKKDSKMQTEFLTAANLQSHFQKLTDKTADEQLVEQKKIAIATRDTATSVAEMVTAVTSGIPATWG